MRKFLALSLASALLCGTAEAAIRTTNVDEVEFFYRVEYVFATQDLTASMSNVDVPIPNAPNNFSYVMPFKGVLVGLGIAADLVFASDEAATANVTINGTVTGVRAGLGTAAGGTDGVEGSSAAQFGSNIQDRDESLVRDVVGRSQTVAAAEATALAVGDRIGVQISTTSAISAQDVVISVYVLQ